MASDWTSPLSIVQLGLDALRRSTPDHLTLQASGPPASTSSGDWIVYARECLGGIVIVGHGRSAVISGDGEVRRVTGRSSEVPPDVVLDPDISAAEALHRALAELFRRRALPGVSIDTEPAEILGRFGDAARSTVLRKPPFEDPVLCRLVLDSTDRGAPLRWEVRVPVPDHPATVLVPATGPDADDVPVRVLSHHRRAWVLRAHTSEPDAGVADVVLPVPAAFYPKGIREPSASTWITRAPRGRDVVGNNARVEGPRGLDIAATTTVSGTLIDTGDHPLGTATSTAVYWCNYLRDFFDRFGFGAAEGGMQDENPAGVSGGSDALEVRVIDAIRGTPGAFTTKPDGSRPTLRLYRNVRHGGEDPHVVIHEYAHGVVNRLVDGRDVGDPLHGEQPEALGEGFCDYFAISVLNWCNELNSYPARWGFASWCMGRPEGLRSALYDQHPGHYRDLADGTADSIHRAGEVWAATLLDLHAVLAEGRPDDGEELAWRICLDSLKALHQGGDAGPHFVHARTAWLTAFDGVARTVDPLAALRGDLEAALQRRGLGATAASHGIRFKDAQPS